MAADDPWAGVPGPAEGMEHPLSIGPSEQGAARPAGFSHGPPNDTTTDIATAHNT